MSEMELMEDLVWSRSEQQYRIIRSRNVRMRRKGYHGGQRDGTFVKSRRD